MIGDQICTVLGHDFFGREFDPMLNFHEFPVCFLVHGARDVCPTNIVGPNKNLIWSKIS